MLLRARSAVARVALAGAAILWLGASLPSAAQTSSPKARPDGRLTQAERALAAGDTSRASELATAYLKEHPNDPAARILIVRAHLDRDELEPAFVQLERALRTNPGHVDVLYYLGVVTAQLAAVRFERLVEQSPTSARAHQLLAESLEAQQRRAEAEQEYEAALAARPDLLDALLGLAKLKRIRLDCDGAVALYARAEAIRASFDGAYGLGSCALRQGDEAAALAHFDRAIELDPKAAVAHVGRASALLGSGRTADAIASLERAVTLEPAMGEAYYLLGRAYQAAGERARSQAAFAKAEQLRRADTPPEPR
jgi:superkiller protein 3